MPKTKKKKRKVNLGRRQPLARRSSLTGHVAKSPRAERDPTRVARAYRRRVYGLNEDQSKDVKAESALGRIVLKWFVPKLPHESEHAALERMRINEMVQSLWESGEWYRSIRAEEQRALLVRQIASAGDLERMGGYDARDGTDPAYVESVQRALERGELCRRALLECGEVLAQMVIEAVVTENKDMPGFSGELRCALNAVDRVRNNLRSDAKAA